MSHELTGKTYVRPESVDDPKECKRLGRERRERIREAILDLLTGPTFHAAELAHFRFVSSCFHLPDRIEALTDASGPDARLELLVSVMLTCAELALDPNKPIQSVRSIEKDMIARYESVARKPAAAGAPATSDTEPEPSAQDKLDRIRQKNRDRQRERRARLKAAQTV